MMDRFTGARRITRRMAQAMIAAAAVAFTLGAYSGLTYSAAARLG